MPTYSFQVLDRPALVLSTAARSGLVHELRALAATCLQPLPDYQCLSTAPDALDDKLIVIMRDKPTKRIIAFVSAVYLKVRLLSTSTEESTVLHTGLTCVAPALRRQGLVMPLFLHLFAYLRARPTFAKGLWLTSLAEVPSTLGNIGEYITDVFPSPGRTAPSDVHLRIARVVDTRYRATMLVAPTARFDEETFVFRGSNPPGSCFRKDTDDPRYHHRDASINEFYRKLLGRNEGNEVLQVGFLDWEVFERLGKIRQVKQQLGIEVRSVGN